MKRLLTYVKRLYIWIFLALILMVIGKVVEAVVPIRLGQLMQQILDGVGSSLGVGLLIVVALVAIAYLLDVANVFILNHIGQTAVFRLRTELFDHLQKLHVGYYDKQRVGQLISRTVSDVERIQLGFSESLISMAGSGFLILCIIGGMYVADWKIALIVTAALPLVAILTWQFGSLQRPAYAAVRKTLGAINTFMQEHLMGAPIIRHFGLEGREREKFDVHNAQYRSDSLKVIHHYAFFFAGIEWIQNFVMALVFVGLVAFGFGGETFQAGTFFTFQLYLMTLFRPLRDLSERYNLYQDALASASRVFQLLDEEPMVRSEPKVEGLTRIESIAFEDVWFAYEGENWVLRGVSMAIEGGEAVALVGETGAGKTTIMSLLSRFYDPQKGVIRVNGRDIRDYRIEELRRHFGVVLQDPVLFSGTVEENVTLFDRSISRERVEEALEYVGAYEFVQRLPGGVGARLEERGKGLSSGERQLLSLARVIAQETPVIMLDEATANIDSLTERMIQEALEKIMKSRMSLVIAHRLSTIHAADNIVVLHEGEVIEQGRHEELIRAKGFYEKLYRWQFEVVD